MRSKIVLVALVLVTPLAAQEPGKHDSMHHHMIGPGGPGPMSGMMMEGSMMEHMGPAITKTMLYMPQHLLARKDALGLTPDQVTRLGALRDATKAAHAGAVVAVTPHMAAIEQTANAAKPDTTTLKSHFQAAHDAMGRAHWAMLAAAVQAQAVLTGAQRAKVQVWADSMQAWRQQHRQMMPPDRPPEKDHP